MLSFVLNQGCKKEARVGHEWEMEGWEKTVHEMLHPKNPNILGVFFQEKMCKIIDQNPNWSLESATVTAMTVECRDQFII